MELEEIVHDLRRVRGRMAERYRVTGDGTLEGSVLKSALSQVDRTVEYLQKGVQEISRSRVVAGEG